MSKVLILASLLVGIARAVSAADIAADAANDRYTITSGPNVLELQRQDNRLYLAWLGPINEKRSHEKTSLLKAVIEDQTIESKDLRLESIRTERDADNARVIAVLTHESLPIEIEVQCVGWSDTGVFWTEVKVTNRGSKPLAVQSLPSLSLTLPSSKSELRYLDGPAPSERQLKRVFVGSKPFQLDNGKAGRSTREISTWWSLYHGDLELAYTAQLAYSGNWTLRVAPTGDSLTADFGIVFDNDGPLLINPGAAFEFPPVAVTVSRGDDIDVGANALHRFQRRHVIPQQPANNPLIVQFNTWYALGGDIDAGSIAKLIPLAAGIGCEAFVIDANWHYCEGSSGKWSDNLGDWKIKPQKFPGGLRSTINAVHERGMKFGIWLEPEVASLKSEVFRDHPEWFLTADGKPLIRGSRAHLDFSLPEVRQRMMSVLADLMQEGQIDWFKFDYNIDIGNRFDSPDAPVRNSKLYEHLRGYYQFLADVARAYPHVVIENCSSGARRWELGTARYTHTSWISDTVNPRYSVQVAYGATVEFAPEICNHWMVGDLAANKRGSNGSTIKTKDPEWWDFMFRVAMNGQTGVSSRLDLWPPAALARARENIELYKRIRPIIRGADVYHLTDPPAAGYNPTGWMGLQYVQPTNEESVLLAYRLGKSDPNRRFHLRGLASERAYQVRIDGLDVMRRTGKELSEQGLLLQIPAEWRAVIVELSRTESATPAGN